MSRILAPFQPQRCWLAVVVKVFFSQRSVYSCATTVLFVNCTLVFCTSAHHQFHVPSFNWGGQSMPPRRLRPQCGPISHPKNVPANTSYWTAMAGIAKRTTTPAHVTTSPVRSHRPKQAITHPLERVLLGSLKDPQTPQATAEPGQSISVSSLATWAPTALIPAASHSWSWHGRDPM